MYGNGKAAVHFQTVRKYDRDETVHVQILLYTSPKKCLRYSCVMITPLSLVSRCNFSKAELHKYELFVSKDDENLIIELESL